MNTNAIREAVSEIRKTLKAFDVPTPNTAAVRRIEAAIATIRSLRRDGDGCGYVSGKLTEIGEWAEDFYSVRKHEKYSGGAGAVKHFILSACDTIEQDCQLFETSKASGNPK